MNRLRSTNFIKKFNSSESFKRAVHDLCQLEISSFANKDKDILERYRDLIVGILGVYGFTTLTTHEEHRIRIYASQGENEYMSIRIDPVTPNERVKIFFVNTYKTTNVKDTNQVDKLIKSFYDISTTATNDSR